MDIVKKINDILGEAENSYKDLGYANSWKDTPDIVEKCKRLKHKISSRTVARSLTEYGCDICNYKYKVDSSG